MKLRLLNEIPGRSTFAPTVFGTQAPDSGNAEILAHFGTEEQKERFLKPLLASEIVSTYAMTEPQAGADPGEFQCSAIRDGDEWVINGQKWFASNFPFASFVIAMVITDPDVPVHKGSSMLLVPKGTPGMEGIRNVGLGLDEEIGGGSNGYLQFTDCRLPAGNLLGEEGAGFQIAPTPKTVMDVVYRAMHLHGALGVSNEMPFTRMLLTGAVLGIADGPTEVHKDTLARQVLKQHKATDGLFPTGHLPARIEMAKAKYAQVLERHLVNQ